MSVAVLNRTVVIYSLSAALCLSVVCIRIGTAESVGFFRRLDDDSYTHEYETEKGECRADDDASGAEYVGVEFLRCAPRSEHEYESDYYKQAGSYHKNEIPACERKLYRCLFDKHACRSLVYYTCAGCVLLGGSGLRRRSLSLSLSLSQIGRAHV